MGGCDNVSLIEEFLEVANQWYESQRNNRGGVKSNVVNSGLIVSRMIRDGFPISDEQFFSKKGSQVRGLSGATIAKILADHGEVRPFTREGGRTSRGTLKIAESYRDELNALTELNFSREEVAEALESFFVRKAQTDFFDRQRLKLEIDQTRPISNFVTNLLEAVRLRADRPDGTVLQHLIGATLELVFPDEEIGRDRANAADKQTNREGDFEISSTAFHVTMSPMEKLIERCADNIRHGVRPVIVTPEGMTAAARQLASVADLHGRIEVLGAEAFVGTQIEVLGDFSAEKIEAQLARLIRAYNLRISEVEFDKSLMIEEPRWVEKASEESRKS